MDRDRHWLREPLLHFLLLGALLLFAHRLLRRSEPEGNVIVITAALRSDLERELAAELGRRPNAGELEAALRTWKAEEVLYREAVKLGLEQADPLVRRRVIGKLLELERELVITREPSDADLDALLTEDPDRYREPPRYDFEHVFVPRERQGGPAHARRLQSELEKGADPQDLGEAFHGGRVLLERTRAGLLQLFGQRFSDALVLMELARWQVLESVHGLHVVRLLRVHEGRAPERERLRPRLVRDWKLAQRQHITLLAQSKYEKNYVFKEAP